MSTATRNAVLRSRKVRRGLLSRDVRASQIKPFGVDAMVGPKGSGKSLLAVHRARRYVKGEVVTPDGKCTCGDKDCDNVWKAYTNLDSTHIDNPASNGKGWAEPIDYAEGLLDSSSSVRHAIFVLDEGYQLADARRGQTTASLKITDRVTQSRKADVLMMVTGVSFDWLDTRIRTQVRQVYNCWSPNNGFHVFALVTSLSLGHLPPWKRARKPTRIFKWFTAPSRAYYNTKETVSDREELKASIEDKFILVPDEHGNMVMVELGDFISEAVADKAQAGFTIINPIEFAAELQQVKHIPVNATYVRNNLLQSGYIRDNQGNFVIGIAR